MVVFVAVAAISHLISCAIARCAVQCQVIHSLISATCHHPCLPLPLCGKDYHCVFEGCLASLVTHLLFVWWMVWVLL